jgi:hypothetical protein
LSPHTQTQQNTQTTTPAPQKERPGIDLSKQL